MIKNLKSKLIICLFLLVTIFSVTSSCYASLSTFTTTLTLDDFKSRAVVSLPSNYVCFVIGNSSYMRCQFFYSYSSTISYVCLSSDNSKVYFYDVNGNKISTVYYFDVTYNNGSWQRDTTASSNSYWYSRLSDEYILCDLTNVSIYNTDKTELLYEIKDFIDTSFNYSFEGIKRGQAKLSIDNLDSSLRMYGYVGCENTFNVGDTLDTSSISSYLRLLAIHSDNSDLNCYLYEGEKLLYYIVDEDNVILDIGYISELLEGYFLYGFPVSDGVDFVFLNNGQVYWNNELTFKYQVDNGSLLTKNEIVSTGSYSYIESNKTSVKITYNGFVYDSNGEVISSAVTSTTNNLSSLYMKEVNTNYFENNVGWNKSCYWLQSIILAGTDSSGNDIDFSNYSVRWSIPTWLTVDSIELGTASYDKYNGVITGFTSNGFLSIQLKIYELLKNHTKDFDIKLEIYNDNGDLILTYLVNSDDIVKNQILNEENNIDKPSYDITDNPGYTGGSSNKDFSNIQNWTSDDYLNLMSTDNFIWSFFKAILGNLPWWITVPMTILIFGVVIITLIRFARGA